jgi:hypothetical protein
MSRRQDDAQKSQPEKTSGKSGSTSGSSKKKADEADAYSEGWRNSSLNPPE